MNRTLSTSLGWSMLIDVITPASYATIIGQRGVTLLHFGFNESTSRLPPQPPRKRFPKGTLAGKVGTGPAYFGAV